MYKIFLLSLLLTGCTLSGGLGIHDPSGDSEFKQEKIVGWIQGAVPLNEDVILYIRHESQPLYREDGYGLNTIGISASHTIGK